MNEHRKMNRRGFLNLSMGAAASAMGLYGLSNAAASSLPMKPVAVGKCASYGEAVLPAVAKLFNLIGGIGSLVKGKSVCIKVNMTGDPRREVGELPARLTFHTHLDVVLAVCKLLDQAGAKRITIVESLLFNRPKEEVFAWAGWDLAALKSSAKDVRIEDTRNKGSWDQYGRIEVPWGGYSYPAYDVNKAYIENDVCISIAKLKEHITAGVTLAMKNMFGITPNAIYGADAGTEDAHSARSILHVGRKKPATDIEEVDPDSPREGGYIVPRVVADLTGARPIHLSIIDGIETMQGGEGYWCRNAKPIKPGVLIAGLNPVCTDAVGMVVMGLDPEAKKGTIPFAHCDNHLLLAAKAGLGTNKLSDIEVRGVPLNEAAHPFDTSLRAPYSENLQKIFIR